MSGPSQRGGRRYRHGAWTLFALTVVMGCVPLVVGLRAHGVASASMAPALQVGDAVLTRPIPPLRARVGDVVTFRDPNGSTRLITHRVLGVEPAGGRVIFETRGDATDTSESWTVARDGHIGRVERCVPHLGHALLALGSTAGRTATLLAPALLLAAIALVPRDRRRGCPRAAMDPPSPVELP